MRRIAVFCGSKQGEGDTYVQVARDLGTLLAGQGLGVVYGGGKTGLMGELADAALAAGGEVVGVIPRGLQELEVAHMGVSHMHVVASMEERKALMAELSQGFITLPGGWGTLDECFEMLTLRQLKLHKKPCALLNAGGYYDDLLTFLDHAGATGFLKARHRAFLLVQNTPEALLNTLLKALPSDDVKGA